MATTQPQLGLYPADFTHAMSADCVAVPASLGSSVSLTMVREPTENSLRSGSVVLPTAK